MFSKISIGELSSAKSHQQEVCILASLMYLTACSTSITDPLHFRFCHFLLLCSFVILSPMTLRFLSGLLFKSLLSLSSIIVSGKVTAYSFVFFNPLIFAGSEVFFLDIFREIETTTIDRCCSQDGVGGPLLGEPCGGQMPLFLPVAKVGGECVLIFLIFSIFDVFNF